MSDKIYIFGHKSPDCDTSCAPKAYEWYLKQKGQDAEAFVLGKLPNEAKWAYKTFELETPKVLEELTPETKVVIMDTTETKQLPDGIEKAEILEIYDHHKLGGLSTSSPLKVTIDTVGCTSTLIFEKFFNEGLEIEKSIAGLLLCAIISDTLNLTSKTTTERDKKAVEELVKLLQINLEDHAKNQFEAKSSLEGMSIEEIVNFDAKDFDMGDKKVRIGVFETTDPSQPLSRKEEIKQQILKDKEANSYDYFLYFVIDILKSNAQPVIVSSKEQALLAKAFEQEVTEDTVLEGVASRKKQVVPVVEKALS